MPVGRISDEEFRKRHAAVYSDAFVAEVTYELTEARKEGETALAAEIQARFTYRMHNLSEFMKTLLQRALYSPRGYRLCFPKICGRSDPPLLQAYRLQVHGLL